MIGKQSKHRYFYNTLIFSEIQKSRCQRNQKFKRQNIQKNNRLYLYIKSHVYNICIDKSSKFWKMLK